MIMFACSNYAFFNKNKLLATNLSPVVTKPPTQLHIVIKSDSIFDDWRLPAFKHHSLPTSSLYPISREVCKKDWMLSPWSWQEVLTMQAPSKVRPSSSQLHLLLTMKAHPVSFSCSLRLFLDYPESTALLPQDSLIMWVITPLSS